MKRLQALFEAAVLLGLAVIITLLIAQGCDHR